MTQKTNSTFSHLKCSKCNIKYSKTDIYNLSPCCTLPLFPQYDLEKAKSILHKRDLKSRESNMWRYREIMPVEFKENIISLGEGWTPLVQANRLGELKGFSNLYLKNESINPTGSFKDR